MLRRVWKNIDVLLLASALLLTAIGLLVLFATSVKAANVVSPVDARNQLIFVLAGLAGLAAAMYVDYHVWYRLAAAAYAASLVLLGVVAVAGHKALGATRWIDIGFFQFQPAEISKVVLIVALAALLSKYYDQLERPRYLIQSLVLVLIPIGLLLAQPDLGSALVLGAIWLAMVAVSPIPKSYLVVLACAALLALPVGLQTLQPYQRDRIATFLNPAADPLGRGFNVVQATIAVGSGQAFGRGLDAGSQSQLNFLPSQHTDFIFSVLAEKLGFVGGSVVIGLFLFLLLRLILVAYHARDRFGLFLAVGITAMMLFQVLVNIGMNLALMPVTGIPLPFISYGGTSLIITLAAIGLAESIVLRHKKISF